MADAMHHYVRDAVLIRRAGLGPYGTTLPAAFQEPVEGHWYQPMGKQAYSRRDEPCGDLAQYVGDGLFITAGSCPSEANLGHYTYLQEQPE